MYWKLIVMVIFLFCLSGCREKVVHKLSSNNQGRVSDLDTDPNSWDLSSIGSTLLLKAIKEDRVEPVDFILSQGISPDIPLLPDGEQPLHVASEFGHTEIAALLLQYGADVNARDNSMLTPLHYAVTRWFPAQDYNAEIVQLLLSKGANVNAADNKQTTPLHGVLYNEEEDEDSMQILHFLLSAGADVHVKDYTGATPLYIALARGHFNMANELIDQGAVLELEVDGKMQTYKGEQAKKMLRTILENIGVRN